VGAVPFTQGLHELPGGGYAWIQPDGGWGWSNAGLVVGRDESLLVDTLFDVPHTARMLEAMAPVVGERPIRSVFNTHSNGDHWFGNQLLRDTEIIATEACDVEMHSPAGTAPQMLRRLEGPAGDFVREVFGPFDWDGLEPTYPTRTFDSTLDLDVGGVEVHLLKLGPAHTGGDAVAYVPSARTLYAGDLLFIGGTPVVWAGPVSNWVAACDAMADLDVETVVPGHGPVTDKAGIRQVRDYLEFVEAAARAKWTAGVPAETAAREISLGDFGRWNEHGRIIQNVLAVYYELDPTLKRVPPADVFALMAELEKAPPA
jgi:cyclase